MTETHDHAPGACFCGACRTRARLAAATIFGFIGKEPGTSLTFTQVFAWCSWCANWHRHGDETSRPGDILHRYAHCASNRSPYAEAGYLTAVTNIPLAVVYGRMRRASAAQAHAIRDGRLTPAIERLQAQVPPVLRPDHHGGRTV